MNETMARALAPLASRTVQERFGVGATKEEYLVPEEVIESAWGVATLVEESAPRVANLSERAKERILELLSLLKCERESPSSGAWPDLLSDPNWVRLQVQAARCVEALGFDLPAWERTEFPIQSAQPGAQAGGAASSQVR